MTGDDVRELQRLLTAHGWPVKADAILGPVTEMAVKGFQRASGLTADGIAGRNTMAMLHRDATEDTDPGEPIPFVQARNYHAGRLRPIRCVVLHTAEIAEVGNAAENLAAWAAGPNAPMASWHFCLDDNSTIQCVREEDTAFAAPGLNSDGIQIELGGRASQTVTDWADPYSQAVLARASRLVADLCRRHSLPVAFVDAAGLLRGESGITTHAECTKAYHRSTHTDPGRGFDVIGFLERVRRA
jgi:N-acetyl-anhydromuramyl-L-alanine amidase AmpD